MIVTSKRCFLNVLTQLLTPEQLIHANYYIGDSADRYNMGGNTQVNINGMGEITYDDSSNNEQSSFYTYAVKHSGCLNPEATNSTIVTGYVDDTPSEELFVNYLNRPATFLKVYNFLFKEQLRFNGVQILILNDADNMKRYGNIICQYLSMNFGVDIVYIDAAYRKNCPGQKNYVGNKQLGLKTITDTRDYSIVNDFNLHLTASEEFGNIANLKTYLYGYDDIDEIRYMFHLLFPNVPIPPGNDPKVIADAMIAMVVAGSTEFQASMNYMDSMKALEERAKYEAVRDDYDWSSDFGEDGGLF